MCEPERRLQTKRKIKFFNLNFKFQIHILLDNQSIKSVKFIFTYPSEHDGSDPDRIRGK